MQLKPWHILQINRLLPGRTFYAPLRGQWHRFQDELGSRTCEIVYEEMGRGHYDLTTKLGPGSTVVDVGAHVGMFTRPLAVAHPEASFICVEPDPANYANLIHNLRGLQNVKLLNIGLWSSNCEIGVVNTPTGNTGGSASRPLKNGGVKAYGWREFRRLYNLDTIDILKMDCEGAEHEILQSPADLEGVGEFVGELHGDRDATRALMRLIAENVPANSVQELDDVGSRRLWRNGQPSRERALEWSSWA